jgi:tRNA1(Val) A37 N6-methylase TrmN6
MAPGQAAAIEEDRIMREAGTSAVEPGALDQVRLEANRQLNPERKADLGQFMTPESVAKFMAGLFSRRTGAIRLLDAGAGVGSLTAAFLNRWGSNEVCATAYEIDGKLASYLRETLHAYGNGRFDAIVVDRDFIQDAVYKITMGRKGAGFTHAILNPPYRKISSDSEHRALLRAVRLETVNLYTAFVGLAIELMAPGGEIVAIVPRSFCNGPYYKPFREWMLAKASVEHIHLFHSRTSAFNDDEVLQENVIIKLVCGKKQGKVTITTASDTGFSDLRAHEYPFTEIVHEGDEQKFIHVPVAPSHSGQDGVPLADCSLADISLEVSTGPVVDFRLREFLREEPEEGTVPLLYPAHFVDGKLEWPRQSRKPNAMIDSPETRKWLYPNGFYTVVRRFSSKEERRRIVAHVVDPSAFRADVIGFENHLNVFHSGKTGIKGDVAHGLAIFLNSTAVDDYFRRFSGHTQVNATDLRLLRYPCRQDLEELGRWAQAQRDLTQELIDRQVAARNGQA